MSPKPKNKNAQSGLDLGFYREKDIEGRKSKMFKKPMLFTILHGNINPF